MIQELINMISKSSEVFAKTILYIFVKFFAIIFNTFRIIFRIFIPIFSKAIVYVIVFLVVVFITYNYIL